MGVLSATTVQKTYKKEVFTIFGNFNIDGSGVPSLLPGGYNIGIESITKPSTGVYLITLDPSIIIYNFLGGPIFSYKPVSPGIVTTDLVLSNFTNSPGAFLEINCYPRVAVGPPPYNVNLGQGNLFLTLNFTTTPVI